VVASDLPFLSDFVVDATNVYWSENDTGDIKRMPLGGGAPTTLANGSPGSYNILAEDDANLYWIDQAHVGKVPKTAATAEFLVPGNLAADPFFPASIAVDAAAAYWTEPPIQKINEIQK